VKSDGVVLEPVRAILRLEGALLLLALVAAYWFFHANWILFIVLILSPDLAMLGYLRNARIGAWCYNAFHTVVGPLLLGAVSIRFHNLLPLAIIWAAHIAMDRAFGYGLKYEDSFGHSHLGMIRKASPRSLR
jgi:hypothetical protein